MSEVASAPTIIGASIGPLRAYIGRQADVIPPTWRMAFEWVFGVVLPVACLVLDPVIFHNWEDSGGIMADVRPLVYSAVVPQIVAMAWWLARRRGPYLLAAYLRVGGVVALIVGVLILPVSLIGLLIDGIGLAGFTPFGTAYAFYRVSRRAAAPGHEERDRAESVRAYAFAAILALGIPMSVQLCADRAMDAAIRTVATARGEAAEIATRAMAVLRYAESDVRIVTAFRAEHDQQRRNAIAHAYEHITGESIEGSVSAD